MQIKLDTELAQVILDGMDLYVRKHGIARAAGAVMVTDQIVTAIRRERQHAAEQTENGQQTSYDSTQNTSST